MRKISFGSFPLCEVRAGDRKCLDRYLIKTFSDSISISDAIRNLATTKDLMYITPDALMKAWLSNKDSFRNDRTMASDRESNNVYDQALKRAFYILKEFYTKIKNAAFYKDYIYYPIYVEKIEKIDVGGNPETGDQYTEVQMNYSFVILSNDLTKNLKIDEIRYDENASLNFLFLFIEFFSGSEFGRSIHSFDQKDYEFLVKLYQFIEQSGKDPIHMTMDLYKLIGLIKDTVNKKNSSYEIGSVSNAVVDEFKADNLKKYRGLIKHRLIDILSKNRSNFGPAEAKIYREAFIDLMNSIFKSEGLSGLYNGVSSKAELNERFQYVYNSNKYREILNLAGELVKYNKLNCKDVISNDQMAFDFKVEHGEYTIETQSQIVAQKYQTFFKQYVQSISTYLEGVIETILDDLKITETIKQAASNALNANITDIAMVQAIIDSQASNIDGYNADNRRLHTLIQNENNLPRHRRNLNAIRTYQNDIRLNDEDIRAANTIIENRQTELQNLNTLNNMLDSFSTNASTTILNTSSKIYEKIRDGVLSAISNDLTFIYDDGKRFFTNEIATEGFLELSNTTGYNLLNPNGSGFNKVVNDMKSGLIPSEKNQKNNPAYFAGEIITSLNDSFDVTANDIVITIRDLIRPAVADALRVSGQNLSDSLQKNNNSFNPFLNSNNNEYSLENKTLESLMAVIDNSLKSRGKKTLGVSAKIEKVLKTEVLQNRFIKIVLTNFKKMFSRKQTKKIIEFDNNISQLHPLIKKLINKNDSDGQRSCQYFKSFILNFDTCEQLYKIKFLVDTHKFLKGLSNMPPKKLSNPMSRLQNVLFDYLGLKDNPVWIISKVNLYLSMPDDLSLTNTGILSKIPKTELMNICKINPSDYWDEKTMGQISQFGNKEIARYHKKIEELETDIRTWKSDKGNLKDNESNKRKELEKRINSAYKKIDQIEEKIVKSRHEEKNYTPNGFLFGDEPDKAEKAELLSDVEKSQLMKNKEEMRSKLLNLNPYDAEDIENMEKNINRINKEQSSHPFDFEDEKTLLSPQERDKNDEKSFEELLRKRDRYENEQKNNL